MVNTLNCTFKFTTYTCLLLILGIEMFNCQKSLCPRFFQYKYDSSNYLYGVITVPTPAYHDDRIELNVKLSIGNARVPKDLDNNIRYLGNVEDVIQKRSLVFSLDFPPWNNFPPQVTYIAVNNEPLCVAEAIQPPGVYRTVNVNLYYIYTIKTFSNSGENEPTFTANMGNSHSFNPNLNGMNNIFEPKIRTNQLPNIFNTNFPFRDQDLFNYQFTKDNANSNDQNYYYNTPKMNRQQPPPYFFHFDSENSNNGYGNSISTTSRNIVKPVNNDNDLDSCGNPTMSSNQLIAFGNDVQMGAHPWIGALFLRLSSAIPKFLCGASLITKQLALTAGHCVATYNVSDLYLTFGRIDIKDWLNENAQNAKVEKAVIHPDYKYDTSDADIAILRFNKELTFTFTVKPICLWDMDSPLQNIVNKTGVVVGWGANENYEDPETLQGLYVPVVSEETCLRSSELFNNITSNRTFCAGKNDQSGPCKGDSGSGFYFLINGKWTIRGIVSRSLSDLSGRCDLMNYAVYLDVARYLQWIHSFL